jgi:RNA polymerase sigma factor (sigma-70 family)
VPDDPDFRALFDAHCAFVWRVLARHGLGPSELPDACQEVFLIVHRRRDAFEGRSAFRTWLYGIAVRVAQAFRKRAHRRREVLGVDVPEGLAEGDPARIAEQREDQIRLSRAVAALSADKREVFVQSEPAPVSASGREAAPQRRLPQRRHANALPGPAPHLSTPEAELALLVPARKLVAVEPARALAYAEQHRASHMAGLFAEEREALAIEALVRLGRSDAARARALLYDHAYPTSAHRPRIRALLAAATPSGAR